MNRRLMDSRPSPEQNCAELADAMALLPLGELNANEEAAVRAHADTCVRCRGALADYDMLLRSVRTAPLALVSSPSRSLFSVDEIILSADLSDHYEVDDAVDAPVNDTAVPTPAPSSEASALPQRRRFARRFAGWSAIAAALLVALLVALLAVELFHLRGHRTRRRGRSMAVTPSPSSHSRPLCSTRFISRLRRMATFGLRQRARLCA
jgi:hypothetical protein